MPFSTTLHHGVNPSSLPKGSLSMPAACQHTTSMQSYLSLPIFPPLMPPHPKDTSPPPPSSLLHYLYQKWMDSPLTTSVNIASGSFLPSGALVVTIGRITSTSPARYQQLIQHSGIPIILPCHIPMLLPCHIRQRKPNPTTCHSSL